MKRSEMIKIIKDFLDLRDEGIITYDSQDSAEYILECCEAFGMLPPTVIVPAFGVKDNMWEPEND